MEQGGPRVQSGQSTFVGRGPELSQGLEVLEDVVAGQGRVLLLGGEPGIGKSRMAEELAARARQLGFQVVWGRCWEAGGAPAYWPWVQSLRSLIRDLDAEDVSARMGPGVMDVAQLLPEIRTLASDVRAPPKLDPDTARFRLFDSVTTFLGKSATARPLMVVLDDLQVADTPSLLLLRFVAGALGDDRILLLGTYRDTELIPNHPLASTLSELVREQTVRRLTLRGLREVEVADFIGGTAGITPPQSLTQAVYDETEGNPLFVHEIIRLLLDEGRLGEGASQPERVLSIPRSVREVIGRRLKPLSAESLHVLSLASILGREFDLDALSGLAERPVHEILELLEEALNVGVITDVPGSNVRMRFSHLLIRDSMHDEIGRARRVQLHGRAGQVLEALYEDDTEPHLAELAHHFFEGTLGRNAEKAIGYAKRAGEQAVLLLAYEEAVRLFRIAIHGWDLNRDKDPRQRSDALLALGDAQARSGDEVGSKETFLQAAEISKRSGLREHLAQAALGYGGRLVWGRAGGDAHTIQLLEEALTAIGEGDSLLRARILARLAGALRDDPSPEPRESLGREAVDLARRLGDPATLAYTLEGEYGAIWKPDNPQERLTIANEIVELGQLARDWERTFSGHHYRLFVFFELGDVPSVYRELEATDRVAEELRQPAHGWLPAAIGVQLALLEGRFLDSESLISSALQQRFGTNRSDALAVHAVHLFHLRREQDRLAEVAEMIRSSALEFRWYLPLRCAVAVLFAELGREAEARVEFEELAAHDFAALPFDNNWLFSMCLLSEVAAFLHDDPRARIMYEKLWPYADRNALAPLAACAGSVSRSLGHLSLVMSDLDHAARHFEAGIAANERMGARPFVAHTQYDLATVSKFRGGPGDLQHATALLGAALVTCDELGMSALRSRVRRALADLGMPPPSVAAEPTVVPGAAQDPQKVGLPTHADTGANSAAEVGSLRLEGEYWTVGYAGKICRLRDSKGIRVLAELLAEPGRPHACLDLERLGASGDSATARAVASGDAGELIDDQARRAYRARLAELRAAIDDARGLGNADRVGAMQEESDFLTRELGRALGLSGRSRRAGSIAERARLNVTRAIKSAMKRIAAVDAELAAHLEVTVHTGTVCVYSPDPWSLIKWHVSIGDGHKG